MKLVVVHYHLRPGGIRRVIELALPHLLRTAPRPIDGVLLATGDAPDSSWNELLRRSIAPVPMRVLIEPAFGYVSQWTSAPAAVPIRIRAALEQLLETEGSDCLVWVHNLGIGRNLCLARELTRACARHHVPILSHHHDWWFENRWLRWREIQASGFRTLRSVAHTLFPLAGNVRHLAINRADALVLRKHLKPDAFWLPNLSHRVPRPKPARLRAVRSWVTRQLGSAPGPVWIVPCRLLRRKNVGEALLLTRWLRPEAWLVTTGGPSSEDERAYAERLATAARQHQWRLRLGLLAGGEPGQPAVAELIALSEVVLLTSLQEGFGLPYLEAAAAERPLVARLLPNMAPDLEQFGFQFPHAYEALLVDPNLFEWLPEARRQRVLFRQWIQQMPQACRRLAAKQAPLLPLDQRQPVPFSQLTLTAQLEVLAQPVQRSWQLCAPLNPYLARWKEQAGRGQLEPARWPASADQWLSGSAYAARFWEAAHRGANRFPDSKTALRLQERFLRTRLNPQNMFPLLWSTDT